MYSACITIYKFVKGHNKQYYQTLMGDSAPQYAFQSHPTESHHILAEL